MTSEEIDKWEKLVGRVRTLLRTDVVAMVEYWLEYPAGKFPPPFVVLREEHLSRNERCFHLYKLQGSDELRKRS